MKIGVVPAQAGTHGYCHQRHLHPYRRPRAGGDPRPVDPRLLTPVFPGDFRPVRCIQ